MISVVFTRSASITPTAASTAASTSASGPVTVKNALPPMPRPSCISVMRTRAALTAASAAATVATTVVVSTTPSESTPPAARALARQRRPQVIVRLRQEQPVDDAIARDVGADAERLLDGGDAPLHQHQELPRADRVGAHQHDRRALEHGVRDAVAARDRRELDQRQRALAARVVAAVVRARGHHTIRKYSFNVQRRSRVKLRAVVSPSPVGDAIVNDV